MNSAGQPATDRATGEESTTPTLEAPGPSEEAGVHCEEVANPTADTTPPSAGGGADKARTKRDKQPSDRARVEYVLSMLVLAL